MVFSNVEQQDLSKINTININKHLLTTKTGADFGIVNFCVYNWKDKKMVELIFAILGQIWK